MFESLELSRLISELRDKTAKYLEERIEEIYDENHFGIARTLGEDKVNAIRNYSNLLKSLKAGLNKQVGMAA